MVWFWALVWWRVWCWCKVGVVSVWGSGVGVSLALFGSRLFGVGVILALFASVVLGVGVILALFASEVWWCFLRLLALFGSGVFGAVCF